MVLKMYSIECVIKMHTHTHTHTRARAHTHTHTHTYIYRMSGLEVYKNVLVTFYYIKAV
jgi:hypothetical protein